MIHVLAGALRLDDSDYRAMLSGYGVSTSTELTAQQAAELIDKLERMAISAGKWRKCPGKQAPVPGRATPKQRAMLIAKWYQVSRAPDDQKVKALDKLINNTFGIACLAWLPMEMVGKVAKVLDIMKAQSQRSDNVVHDKQACS
jgi:hypothetical protein